MQVVISIFVTVVSISMSMPVYAADVSKKIVMEEFMVPAVDSGISL
jgi:hypothetical protein